ncbi:hypothetical protein ACFQY5_39995 [Paeniroseomonas aquatica]|uniref:Uncharacterized protein n=1 Tax=Paeniroseomonas aquatica TaxID=373043 RepID=A0ABT8A091_9PROT|nr:hypothetical protein [Paeniroseomonas aquatica]MDN3563106.1 hypothetical protein [Paeniroseomonas aquatica]
MRPNRLPAIAAVLREVLQQSGRTITVFDQPTRQTLPVSLDIAVSERGLLPVFLASGQAVWQDATGHGLGVELQRDRDTVLGYRAISVGSASTAVVLLSTMEAIERVAALGILQVNRLNAVWRDAMARAATVQPEADYTLAPSSPFRRVAR